MNIVLLQIFPNSGYRPSQVGTSMTLGDMFAYIQEAIDVYGADALVITKNDQTRGACFGNIASRPFVAYDEEG